MIEIQKRLKFIHIPKNAGTSIEDNALDHNILWGRYDNVLKWYIKKIPGAPFWHTPLRLIPKYRLEEMLKYYDFFAVVRNPYDHCLSEFHYYVKIGKLKKDGDKDYLNKVICRYIKQNRDMDHWAPQSNFIYDENGQVIVKYVLYFEHLESHFNWLMQKYGMDNIKLQKQSNVSDKNFTVTDLYPETIATINKFYHDDFTNFGYDSL
jgi:hypothetical protein